MPEHFIRTTIAYLDIIHSTTPIDGKGSASRAIHSNNSSSHFESAKELPSIHALSVKQYKKTKLFNITSTEKNNMVHISSKRLIPCLSEYRFYYSH